MRNDRWGRTFESFGEVPELPSSMTSYITGLQGADVGAGRPSVLATAKHYVADGGSDGGHDRGNVTLTEDELRAIHLPPYQAAIARHVGAVMVSYGSWNGVPMHAQRHLITDVLKTELGFTGFVVSDYLGVDAIDGQWGVTADEVATAVNAGIDMFMGPLNTSQFISFARARVLDGTIPVSRIDDAVRRILIQKFSLGIFEHPLVDRTLLSTVGSSAHRDLARQAVRESLVVLKNDQQMLPLAKSAKVFVAGKNADNIGNQSGGWTIGWQGQSGPVTQGTTILQGVRASVDDASQVTYNRTGDGIDASYGAAIAVVGETPYAEFLGDNQGSLTLDQEDLATLTKLRASGVPVVVVLVSGRPLDITSQLPNWRALVAAWLPGTEGRGVADVLFGDAKPVGKLPVTWMVDATQQPINVGDGKTGLFPFGYGLTYP